MTAQDLVILIFGASGGGALLGIWQIIQALKKGKLDKEDTLIKRLDENHRKEREAREEAETDAAKYRRQRNRAQDQAAKFRRMLITAGANSDELDQLEEYDD